MTGIYAITSPTGKVYVGQSWVIEKRVIYYRNNCCKGQRKIYNSIKKHGWGTHKFEVILELRDDVSQETLDFWEDYFITFYKVMVPEMLNIRGGGSRGKLSLESRKLISDNHKDVSGKNHPQYGKNLKDSTKRLISEANSKYVRTKQHREKTSASMKGRPSPMKGKKHTTQAKFNMTKSHTKAVLQYSNEGNFIKKWDSVKEAAEFVGLHGTNISKACKNPKYRAAGFQWMYENMPEIFKLEIVKKP